MVLLCIDTITIAISTVILEYSTWFDDSTAIYILINIIAVIAVETSISLSMIIKHKTVR